MPRTNETEKITNLIKTLLLIILIAALANCIYLLSIPADEKNAIILNYSLNRLIIAGFLIAGAAASAYGWVRMNQNGNVLTSKISTFMQKPWMITALVFSFVITILFLWMALMAPPYILQKTRPIVERLLPVGVWLLVVSGSGVFLAGRLKDKSQNRLKTNSKITRSYMLSTAIVLIFLLAGIILYPKLADDVNIGRYSVPLLVTQIVLTWAIITLLSQVFRNLKVPVNGFVARHLDVIIFVGLWAAAIILWVSQPIPFMEDKYFTTIHQHLRPLPPNYEIYPSRDSQAYYFISESIVVGQGIYKSLDKSLFLAFQGLNNWLSGGSYARMLNTQILILAVSPAFIYLIGRELHSRKAGLMVGVLAVLHEFNGLRVVDELPLATVKTLLSEPWVQVFCVVLTWFAIRALKKEHDKTRTYLFLACGGVLGLSSVIRLNTLVIAPFILFILFIRFIKKPRKLIVKGAFFLFGIILALTPLMLHHADRYNNPLAFMRGKVQNLILNNRYRKIIRSSSIDLTRVETQTASDFPDNLLQRWTVPFSQIGDQEFPMMMFFSDNVLGYARGNQMLRQALEPAPTFIEPYSKVALVVLRHFINNSISSFSILPTALMPQNTYHAIRGQLFWGTYDEAQFLPVSGWMVAINLIILIIGMGSSINKNQHRGIIPLMVFAGYHLSSALAVTSGNRYTQPVTWIVFVYYGIGLITLSDILLNYVNGLPNKKRQQESLTKQRHLNKVLALSVTTLLILIIGNAPAAADRLPARRYPRVEKEALITEFLNQQTCLDIEDTAKIITTIQESNPKNLYASFGKALQPIEYDHQTFEAVNHSSPQIKGDPFLTYLFLGSHSRTPSRVFFESSNDIPKLAHGSEMILIWSKENKVNRVVMMGVINQLTGVTRYDVDEINNLSLQCWIGDIS